MSANWTDREVFRLIDCWSEEGIQEQLEGARRNKHVYDKLSRSLAEHDIEKTGEQCRTKVKKLRQEYKKIKDNHNLTGRGRIQWKFFEKLDKILGTRPATRPQVLLETLDSQPQNDPSSDETDIGEQEDGYNNTADDSTLDNLDSSEASGSGTPTVIRSRTPSQNSSRSGSLESDDSDKRGGSSIKGKKRKRSKGEVLEEVMSEVMKTMTDGLKSSDKMFTELEEKRMKFEEQQRKEDREFQLKMMQMLQQGMGGVNNFYSPYGSVPPPPSPGLYYSPPGHTSNDS